MERGGRSRFYESTESIRDDDNPSQGIADKINYLATDLDEYFKTNIPQTDPMRKAYDEWELVGKKCLQKLESYLISASETTCIVTECYKDNQYDLPSVDRAASKEQDIKEFSLQPADTDSDFVQFVSELNTQDDDDLQESSGNSHVRDSSDVPSKPGADTIENYLRQLVPSGNLMPTMDKDGSRLVHPQPLSTGHSSSTVQEQQLSTPAPVESIPTGRPEDGLTTGRPENIGLTTSTSQEGLHTGMASEISGHHELVLPGEKLPDIRKEEEKTDYGDSEHFRKIEKKHIRTTVAAISQYHRRKDFKGTARYPVSTPPIAGKYQWEIFSEAYFSVPCVLESAAKITLCLRSEEIFEFQKQDLKTCCKPFFEAFPEEDREILPTSEQLVGIRNAIAHANTEYLVDSQSLKCGLEVEKNDIIFRTRRGAHHVESFRSSTDVFFKVCERMRTVFLEWGPVREYLPQGASNNVSGHGDEGSEPVESIEEDTSIP